MKIKRFRDIKESFNGNNDKETIDVFLQDLKDDFWHARFGCYLDDDNLEELYFLEVIAANDTNMSWGVLYPYLAEFTDRIEDMKYKLDHCVIRHDWDGAMAERLKNKSRYNNLPESMENEDIMYIVVYFKKGNKK